MAAGAGTPERTSHAHRCLRGHDEDRPAHAHDYESALPSTVLKAFSSPSSSWRSWLSFPSRRLDRAVLWPRPACGSAAVTCAAQEASCRQSTIRAHRAGVFRCRLMARGAVGNSKEAGEAQSWARLAISEEIAPTWASCSSTRPN